MVRKEHRAVLAEQECPKMQTEFGCCIRGCKFAHPDGWNWKDAERKFKASKKVPATPPPRGAATVPNAPVKAMPVKMIDVATEVVRKLDFTATDFPLLAGSGMARFELTPVVTVNPVTSVITVELKAVGTTRRPARALTCHPCKHAGNCKKSDCKFVHSGQGCQHGHRVCDGVVCPNLQRNLKVRMDKH